MFLYFQFIKKLSITEISIFSSLIENFISAISYSFQMDYVGGKTPLSSLTDNEDMRNILESLDCLIKDQNDEKNIVNILIYLNINSSTLENKLKIYLFKNITGSARKSIIDHILSSLPLKDNYSIEINESNYVFEDRLFSAQYEGICYNYSVNEFIIKLIKTIYGKSTWKVIEKI